MVDTADIIDFENGDLSAHETVMLFADLICSGLAWTLQGAYGRAAAGFIDAGIISPEGEVLQEIEDEEDMGDSLLDSEMEALGWPPFDRV